MAITFLVTGCAAHARLSPLLPKNWKDAANDTPSAPSSWPSLIWENAPRHQTKGARDGARCYSHLPNGTAVLDSKWSLARLMRGCDQLGALATLETHCFRGRSGFAKFWSERRDNREVGETHAQEGAAKLPDLLDPEALSTSQRLPLPTPPINLWVIKDATSNGAGGIWVVGEENRSHFTNPRLSPLIEEHRYVAQQYTWPMVLYGGRKCHVRVYGVMTSDNRAYLHEKCFLHVANEPFQTDSSLSEDAVHITNCCANSHDPAKFAGEIVASLVPPQREHGVVDLSRFYPSMAASLATLAERAFPYVRGGDMNGGFEYLGMDFILSERGHEPIAYLLEVNAPPSQDTATGLPHAEALHNAVISDLIDMWVLPRITGAAPELGGWKCVYHDVQFQPWDIQPSKAVILNKIRWAILERKLSKEESLSSAKIVPFVRSQFPYFPSEQIFFENAGGAQVPRQVTERVVDSLKHRHRCVIGSRIKEEARKTLLTLLGTSGESHKLFLGSNATALLDTLASKYSDQLKGDDEIVLATENHLANVTPWTRLAMQTGARIKWWPLGGAVEDVVTYQTRIVAMSHASNILGQVRDIQAVSTRIKAIAPNAKIIVDGVATVPHLCADLEKNEAVDWYVISCHKLFGPHLGALCGRLDAVQKLHPSIDGGYGWFEVGTLNYEACSGVVGLGIYFQRLANFEVAGISSSEDELIAAQPQLSTREVVSAYQRIRMAEKMLVTRLRSKLKANKSLRVIEDSIASLRLPVFSFCHETIPAGKIVASFCEMGIQCRSGNFLSTDQLQSELKFDSVVRMSLAHYNTTLEIDHVFGRLQQMQDNMQLL
jgi:selenocysteine lyase/cysteine desulfurase